MPLPARAPARIVCVRKSKRGKLPRGGAKDERVPPVCVGRLRCHRCVDGRKWCDRDGAGMQESRAARHALLRREQRSRRRRADRSEKAGAILPRWYSPTRRWRIRRSIRTYSSRSPTFWLSVPASAWSITPCNRTRPRSRRCAPAVCTSPDSRPGRPDSPSIWRARCRSRPRAPRRDRKATTCSRSSRRTAPTRSSPTSRASALRTHRRRRIQAISRRSCFTRRKASSRTRTTSR